MRRPLYDRGELNRKKEDGEKEGEENYESPAWNLGELVDAIVLTNDNTVPSI